jgi:ATP-dependent Lhr-like helicase
MHELMSALTAYRISVSSRVLTMAMNAIMVSKSSQTVQCRGITRRRSLSMNNLKEDLLHCVNESEMTRRKFETRVFPV